MTKIVGVTKKNDDGSKRQEILKKCKSGDILTLKREPENKYDRNAIAVFRDTEQLGYLSKTNARELAKLMDTGKKLTATISEITGGEQDKPTYGCNIKISGATWDYEDEDEFLEEDEDEEDRYHRWGRGKRIARADLGCGKGCLIALGILIALFIIYFMK
jgi:hypothetical protein